MTMDERTFEERVRALEPKLYRTACAMLWSDADAADAMQECIIKAWRRLGSLKDEERFEAWTMRILINECHDARRRGRRSAAVSFDEAIGESESARQAPVDIGLREALRELPEKYRLPLLLHHMNGYSLDEIAPMLRLPLSTLKGRLYQARKLLKTILDREAVR